MKKIKKKIELKKETITRLNASQLKSLLGGFTDDKKTSGQTLPGGPYIHTCGSAETNGC